MTKKQPDINIPQHEIEALARCLLPEIQKFFESPEGQKEFEEWKAQRAKEVEKERKRKERMTKAAVSLTIPPFLL